MLYNESDETNICNIHKKEGASRKYYIHHSSFIYNQFKKFNLCKSYSNRVINHLMSILISIFISGYHGKTTDFAKNSSCHRTTIAHFLNSGKWDDPLLADTLKRSVIEIIYSEAARTGKPVFCIVDDTIASKTKPSSRALHPIEDAYFHQSHLKGKQAYDLEDYTGDTAFLIGNEGNGLTDETAAMADTYVRIPMEGSVESLNAAVAASVLMFEAARQRRNSQQGNN